MNYRFIDPWQDHNYISGSNYRILTPLESSPKHRQTLLLNQVLSLDLEIKL